MVPRFSIKLRHWCSICTGPIRRPYDRCVGHSDVQEPRGGCAARKPVACYGGGFSEIYKGQGGLLRVDGLVELLDQSAAQSGSRVGHVRREAHVLQGSPEFKDDISLVELEFN